MHSSSFSTTFIHLLSSVLEELAPSGTETETELRVVLFEENDQRRRGVMQRCDRYNPALYYFLTAARPEMFYSSYTATVFQRLRFSSTFYLIYLVFKMAPFLSVYRDISCCGTSQVVGQVLTCCSSL